MSNNKGRTLPFHLQKFEVVAINLGVFQKTSCYIRLKNESDIVLVVEDVRDELADLEGHRPVCLQSDEILIPRVLGPASTCNGN